MAHLSRVPLQPTQMNHLPPPFTPSPQHWLTDEDVDEVIAQYDTNRDGVIK